MSASGRQPLGGVSDHVVEPRRGDTPSGLPHPVVSPLRGFFAFARLFQGLTPLAISFRPFGTDENVGNDKVLRLRLQNSTSIDGTCHQQT